MESAVSPVRSVLGTVAKHTLDLLFPERCIACGRFGPSLCDVCHVSMPPLSREGRCEHCMSAWDGTGFCPRCLHWDALDGAIAAFEHDGVARRVVHGLKYSRTRSLAAVMASHLGSLPGTDPAALAVAIPLHRSRRKRRGFNQAAEILRHLPWQRLPGELRRTRNTGSQVGMSLTERRRNVAGAFAYRGVELEGASVVLVDDVVTSGATANECARVLKDFGAGKVVAVSFTRASWDMDGPGGISD